MEEVGHLRLANVGLSPQRKLQAYKSLSPRGTLKEHSVFLSPEVELQAEHNAADNDSQALPWNGLGVEKVHLLPSLWGSAPTVVG